MTNLTNNQSFNSETASKHTAEEVMDLMKTLKMSAMRETFKEQKDSSAFYQFGLPDQLHMLLSAEVDKRRNNSYRRHLRLSGRENIISAVDFAGRQDAYNLTGSQMDFLLSCKWFGEQTLVIVGPSGSGKTDCCSAIIEAACRAGKRALNLRYPMLALTLSERMSSASEFAACLKHPVSFNLLVIDDFCICTQLRPNEAEAVKELLDACAEKHCGLIVSSQLSNIGWIKYFGGGAIAEAIVERIMFKSKYFLVKLPDKSYRAGEAAEIPDGTSTSGSKGRRGRHEKAAK